MMDATIAKLLDKAGHPNTSDLEAAAFVKGAYKRLNGATFMGLSKHPRTPTEPTFGQRYAEMQVRQVQRKLAARERDIIALKKALRKVVKVARQELYGTTAQEPSVP